MNLKNSWLLTKPIAHRGLHSEDIPENSLLSYEKAIEKGFPIEIDIRIIDDGTVIVFHDDKLGRMTDNDGYASNLRTADLSQLHLKGSEQTIPTFEQVLELVNGRTPLLIETKVTGKVGPLESKVTEILKGYNGEFAMQSFDPYSMEYFRKHEPDFLRGQLSQVFPKGSTDLSGFKRRALSHLKVAKISEPHFISYNGANLPNKYVTKKELPVLAWTVRSNAEYEKVAPYCDNIIFERFLPETE